MAWMGERLRQAREWRGLTGEQLAQRVGISSSYVSEREHNRNNPSLELLKRLAAALDVLPAWFIDPNIVSPLDPEWPARAAQTGLDGEEWLLYVRLARKVRDLGLDPAFLERLVDALAAARPGAVPAQPASPAVEE